MCLEDMMLGMDSPASMVPFIVGASAINVVGQSPKRTAVILGPPDSGTVTYSPNPNPTAGQGFNVNANQDPIVVRTELWGNLPQSAWFAIGSGANLGAAVGEVFGPPELERARGESR